MALGPGKYDAECTEIRKKVNAEGVILIVIGKEPNRSGFSCQCDIKTVLALPRLLREIAEQMEEDLKEGRV